MDAKCLKTQGLTIWTYINSSMFYCMKNRKERSMSRLSNVQALQTSRVLQTFINKIISSEHAYFTRQDVFYSLCFKLQLWTNQTHLGTWFTNSWVSTELLRVVAANLALLSLLHIIIIALYINITYFLSSHLKIQYFNFVFEGFSFQLYSNL